jgi:hypothetical protein
MENTILDQNQEFGVPELPKNYLTESILATLFCCLPFGIAAIVNASKVNSLHAAGDYVEAEHAAGLARKWMNYSVVGGIIGGIIQIILIMASNN